MAMESQSRLGSGVMNGSAITPPPSLPLSDADHFGWNQWDVEDFQELDDHLIFDSSAYSLPEPSGHPATLDHTTVAILSSPPRPPSSTRSFSTRHSPQSPDETVLSVHITEESTNHDSTNASMSPSPPQQRPIAALSRKRLAVSQGSANADGHSKRPRIAPGERSEAGRGVEPSPEIVDLLPEEDVLLSSMVQQQEEQRKKDREPTKLSQLQCVICLEAPTDLTSTICGHIFCHTCLMTALSNSEASRNKCPVCRHSVNRVKKNNKGEYLDFQPLELKFTTRAARSRGPKANPTVVIDGQRKAGQSMAA